MPNNLQVCDSKYDKQSVKQRKVKEKFAKGVKPPKSLRESPHKRLPSLFSMIHLFPAPSSVRTKDEAI